MGSNKNKNKKLEEAPIVEEVVKEVVEAPEVEKIDYKKLYLEEKAKAEALSAPESSENFSKMQKNYAVTYVNDSDVKAWKKLGWKLV